MVSNLRSLQKSHDLIVINENVATNDTTRREDLLYILVELRAAQSSWELGRGSAIHLVDFTPLFMFRDVHQLTRKTITPEQESKPRPRTCRAKQGNNIIRCRCLGFTCFMSAFYGSCQSEYTKSYFLTLVFFRLQFFFSHFSTNKLKGNERLENWSINQLDANRQQFGLLIGYHEAVVKGKYDREPPASASQKPVVFSL